MITQACDVKQLVAVRLARGSDILKSISAAAKEHDIENGVITMGIGAVERYHGLVFDADTTLAGVMAMLSLSGVIVRGRPHLHMTFGNGDRVFGGDLAEGILAGIFAVVMIADTPEMDLSGWGVVD